jgi:hypothetical protein
MSTYLFERTETPVRTARTFAAGHNIVFTDTASSRDCSGKEATWRPWHKCERTIKTDFKNRKDMEPSGPMKGGEYDKLSNY